MIADYEDPSDYELQMFEYTVQLTDDARPFDEVDHVEPMNWCREQFGSMKEHWNFWWLWIDDGNHSGTSWRGFCFRNEVDAMAFKLRWS